MNGNKTKTVELLRGMGLTRAAARKLYDTVRIHDIFWGKLLEAENDGDLYRSDLPEFETRVKLFSDCCERYHARIVASGVITSVEGGAPNLYYFTEVSGVKRLI
jgi:hypothetical protein